MNTIAQAKQSWRISLSAQRLAELRHSRHK